jgi:hypothetical protein
MFSTTEDDIFARELFHLPSARKIETFSGIVIVML